MYVIIAIQPRNCKISFSLDKIEEYSSESGVYGDIFSPSDPETLKLSVQKYEPGALGMSFFFQYPAFPKLRGMGGKMTFPVPPSSYSFENFRYLGV